MSVPGLIIAAPASGSGKTTLVLALLKHLRDRGMAVASCKTGPDYIDPKFHEAASGRPCFNLDPWAMRAETLRSVTETAGAGAELLIVEGVMGLFDGAPGGAGATADLAALTGWPVVLVVDAAAQAQSAAALVHGFRTFRPDLTLAGVIFNRIGSPGHGALIEGAMAPSGLPVLGFVPRNAALALPDRHLGLVPAGEIDRLDDFLTAAAGHVAAHVDIPGLTALARPAVSAPAARSLRLPAPGQRIAVAHDVAFCFFYPHLAAAWRDAGAELIPFSPLADQPPDPAADAVFLPGGYPELHAGRLAANVGFMDGLRAAAARGAIIYGECGGYMVLGDFLEDGAGIRHAMAALLPVATSFAQRRLHLGYRAITLRHPCFLGTAGAGWRGHEFHYASIVREDGPPLFSAASVRADATMEAGCVRGRVAGSFLHVIDVAAGSGPALV